MFCPKCGSKLIEGAAFCASCGTKLDFLQNRFRPENNISGKEEIPDESAVTEEIFAAEAKEDSYRDIDRMDLNDQDDGRNLDDYYSDEPAPKKSKKPLIIALCIIAAVVIAGAAVFASGLFRKGTPQAQIKSAAEKTTDAISGRSELLTFINEFKNANQFGLTVRAENIGEMLSSLSPFMSYLQMEGEVSCAADRKGNASVNLDLDAFGSKIKAGYYSSDSGDGDLVVDVPSVLKNPYGISLRTISEDLDQSILAPGSGSNYALPVSTFEGMKQTLGSFGNMAGSASHLDIQELLKELQKNEKTKIEFKKTKEETDAGNGNIKCDCYTIELDETKIVAILDFCAEWMEERVDIENNSVLFAAISNITGSPMSPKTFISRLSDALSDTDIKLDLRYYVYKGFLVKTAIDGTAADQDIKTSITFGSDPSKTDEIVISAEVAGQDSTVKIDLSDAKSDSYRITVKSQSSGLNAKIGFDYDSDHSRFKMLIDNEGYSVNVSGGMKVEKDTLIISDPLLSQDNFGEYELDGLSLILTKSPVIRKCKDDYPNGYKNIIKLSEEEFSEIADLIQGLGSTISSMF